MWRKAAYDTTDIGDERYRREAAGVARIFSPFVWRITPQINCASYGFHLANTWQNQLAVRRVSPAFLRIPSVCAFVAYETSFGHDH
jgi:hypothetical protein